MDQQLDYGGVSQLSRTLPLSDSQGAFRVGTTIFRLTFSKERIMRVPLIVAVAITMGMLCGCAENTLNAHRNDGKPRHSGAPTADSYADPYDEGMHSQTLEGNTR